MREALTKQRPATAGPQRAARAGPSGPRLAPQHAKVLDLQRAAGNRAVAQLVGSKAPTGPALPGPPASGATPAAPKIPKGKPVDKVGIVAHDGKGGDGAPPGLNLRSVPSDQDNAPLGRLPHNQRLYIKERLPHDWIYVVASDGRSGYVSAKYVIDQDNMPDPGAQLHRIKPGETAFHVVGKQYGAWAYEAGKDARFYSNVLVYANEDQKRHGIRKPTAAETKQLIKEVGFGKYLDAWTVAGEEIWIPSKEFADTLKGQVSSGSFARDTWEKAKDLAKGALEFAVKIPAFVGGLLVGVGESLIDAVKGVVDLVKSIVTGEIVDTISDLVDIVTDKKKRKEILYALGESLGRKWDHNNPVKRWYWRGWLIGYVVGEVLGSILSAGAGAAIKASKIPAAFSKLVKGLGPVKKAAKAAGKMAKSAPVRMAGKAAKFGKGLFGKVGALFEKVKKGVGKVVDTLKGKLAVHRLQARIKKMAGKYGFPPNRLGRFVEFAVKHDLRIWLRKGNPASLRHLEKGAVPKPELVKSKTITKEDLYLNPALKPDDVGLVGYFEPQWPGSKPPKGVSDDDWQKVLHRWAQRETEFVDNKKTMELLQKDWRDPARKGLDKEAGNFQVKVEGGVVKAVDVEAGEVRAIAGDIDVLQITAADGSPARRGGHIDDILLEADLTEHGPHLWWKPKGEADLEIDLNVLSSHQGGGLLEVGPDGLREAAGSQVPGFANRLKEAKAAAK